MVETRSANPVDDSDQVTNPDRRETRQQQVENISSQHWLNKEVELSKYNAGLKLIPEFDGKNWEEFKRKLETQFVIMGLDTYLLHDPIQTRSWEIRNDRLATAQISLRLTQAQYKQVSTCTTTRQIWSRLNEIYETSAEAKASELFLQFIHSTKKPTQTMKNYLDKIVELHHDLRVYNIELSELAVCVKTLDGLPESYRQIKAAARAAQVTTIPRLTNLLLSSEQDGVSSMNDTKQPRNQDPDIKSLNTEAKRWKNNSKKNKPCAKCKKTNHEIDQCWFAHPELRKHQRKGYTNHNQQEQEEIEEEEFNGFHTISKQGKWEKSKNAMIVDSGANVSMTQDKHLLTKYQTLKRPSPVTASNGGTLQAIGKGTLTLSRSPPISIPDVLHVPNITKTLLATNSLTTQGYQISIKKDLHVLNESGKIVLTAYNQNGLYHLKPIREHEAHSTTSRAKINLHNAHQRFGHACDERLRKIPEHCDGIDIMIDERPRCSGCALGQARRQPFPSERTTKSTRKFEIVSSDLKGPLLTTSQGYQYYITFNCLYSKWCWVTFLKTKSPEEVKESIERFLADGKAETKERLSILLTDNGGEYVNKTVSDFLLIKGIKHQRTVPYSPQQNGTAERRNLTIMNMARTILIDAGLPPEFWIFAVRYAVYTQNRLPTKSIQWRTPHELWCDIKPDVRHMRTFGCVAYSHINSSLRTSLDPTAEPGIFLGYSQYSKGYIFMRDNDKQVLVRRDMTFDESSFPRQRPPEPIDDQDPLALSHDQYSNYHTTQSEVPNTFKDALQSPDSAFWMRAAATEMKAHSENGTWTLVDSIPEGHRPIRGKWVFTKKMDNGHPTFKARFVARGFTQRYGLDYTDTFSSVLTYTSLRFIVSLATKRNWPLSHRDFRTAYLNAQLLEPIYMTQPEGFVQPGAENKVCFLNKALYGLKQAGRAWQTTLFKTLKDTNLQQSGYEPCIWYRTSGQLVIIIGIYVDDLLITGNDKVKIAEIDQILHSTYRMKDLGEVKTFLGIEILHQEANSIITQRAYILQLLRRFKQVNCKPESTPATGCEITDENIVPNIYPIREALGALMFIANATRPDIAYIVNKLSRSVSKPTTQLWRYVQRIFKYLKGTANYGLMFGRPDETIACYADSSFADDVNDRKSTTGWLLMFGQDIISWRSTKQKSVALSTTESEYMACCDAAKEAIWLKNLYQEMIEKTSQPVIIFQDNQSAIFLAKNNVTQRRTKHIDIRYHFIREQVKELTIELRYCSTDKMTADILTKPLGPNSFKKHRDEVVVRFESKGRVR